MLPPPKAREAGRRKTPRKSPFPGEPSFPGSSIWEGWPAKAKHAGAGAARVKRLQAAGAKGGDVRMARRGHGKGRPGRSRQAANVTPDAAVGSFLPLDAAAFRCLVRKGLSLGLGKWSSRPGVSVEPWKKLISAFHEARHKLGLGERKAFDML